MPSTKKPLAPVYKRVKRYAIVATCPNCHQELEGNNSIAYPYRCSCGVWQCSWLTHIWSIVPVPPPAIKPSDLWPEEG